MARRVGQTFPSDHRRYFRVMEDILDDPRIAQLSGDEFRAYIRLLAMLNRTKSKTGEITLDRYSLTVCTMRAQVRHAEKILGALVEHGLCTLRALGEHSECTRSALGVHYVITVSKWPERQGFAPPPIPTPIPTPVPNRNRPAKRGPTACPAELDNETKVRIADWASKQDPPIPAEHLGPAWEALRDWATAKNARKADWAATFRSALRKGWVLEGIGKVTKLRDKESHGEMVSRKNREAAQSAMAKHRARNRGGITSG